MIGHAHDVARHVDVERRERSRRHVLLVADRKPIERAADDVPAPLAPLERAPVELRADADASRTAAASGVRGDGLRCWRWRGAVSVSSRRTIGSTSTCAALPRATVSASDGRVKRTVPLHAARARTPKARPRLERRSAEREEEETGEPWWRGLRGRVEGARPGPADVAQAIAGLQLKTGGKSELRRVRCQVTPGGGNAQESATEE